jgi:hypothetical protein
MSLIFPPDSPFASRAQNYLSSRPAWTKIAVAFVAGVVVTGVALKFPTAGSSAKDGDSATVDTNSGASTGETPGARSASTLPKVRTIPLHRSDRQAAASAPDRAASPASAGDAQAQAKPAPQPRPQPTAETQPAVTQPAAPSQAAETPAASPPTENAASAPEGDFERSITLSAEAPLPMARPDEAQAATAAAAATRNAQTRRSARAARNARAQRAREARARARHERRDYLDERRAYWDERRAYRYERHYGYRERPSAYRSPVPFFFN